jgi:hypothetical protein
MVLAEPGGVASVTGFGLVCPLKDSGPKPTNAKAKARLIRIKNATVPIANRSLMKLSKDVY